VAPAAAALDHHITVQTIQVRNDDGTPGPNPVRTIDVAAVNKIFAQADADVTFLDLVYLDATEHLILETTEEFRDLTLTPGHGQHADPLVINLWLVQSASPTAAGQSWVGGNGVVVNGDVVNQAQVPAHLMGHNLGLGHIVDGSEPNNLMVPAPLPCGLGDIYPDGLGRCYLNPSQVATIQASPFVLYVDLTPPAAPVLSLDDGETWRQVTWQNPTAPDFDHTCLYRGETPGFAEGEAVYCGGGTAYDEDHLRRWYYRARSFDSHGNASAWSNEVVGQYPTPVLGAAPAALRLHPNQPNPFNPLTTLRFDLPAGGRVRLGVYDVAGRLVRTVLDADLPAGEHAALWDGRNEQGLGVASGSYLARLEAGGLRRTARLSLVR
jgi:hypothetical protein